MIIFKITDKNLKLTNYLECDENGKFVKYARKENKFCEFNNELFLRFMNAITFNDDCVKVKSNNDYEVFLNTRNNIKHFFKNGEEDFEMFFLHNTEDANLYDKEEKSWKEVFKSEWKTLTLMTTSMILAGLITSNFYNWYGWVLRAEDISSALEQSREIVSEANLNRSDINYEKIVSYINNSPLPDELKKDYLNEKDLIEGLLSFYSNNDFDFDLLRRLTGLEAKYDIENFVEKETQNVVVGYYQSNNNSIHYIKNPEYNTKIHEFAHVFQNYEGNYLYYLVEGVNTIVVREYASNEDDDFTKSFNYSGSANMASLLMEIVGKQPVLDAIYNNDSSSLEAIFTNNLSKDDSDELMNCLSKKPSMDITNKINDILCILYKNMYGKDITEDLDILYNKYYQDLNAVPVKYVLNKSKYRLNQLKLTKNECIKFGFDYTSTFIYYIQKEVSFQEYLDYYHPKGVFQNEKITIDFENEKVILNNEGTIEIPFEKSSILDSLGIKFYINRETDNITRIPDGWTLSDKEKLVYHSINDPRITNKSINADDVVYTPIPIEERMLINNSVVSKQLS